MHVPSCSVVRALLCTRSRCTCVCALLLSYCPLGNHADGVLQAEAGKQEPVAGDMGTEIETGFLLMEDRLLRLFGWWVYPRRSCATCRERSICTQIGRFAYTVHFGGKGAAHHGSEIIAAFRNTLRNSGDDQALCWKRPDGQQEYMIGYRGSPGVYVEYRTIFITESVSSLCRDHDVRKPFPIISSPYFASAEDETMAMVMVTDGNDYDSDDAIFSPQVYC